MSEPIAPPTESGWYVVEWRAGRREIIEFDGKFNQHLETGLEGWNDTRWDKVVAWSGPLDLEALLEQGGKG